MISLNRIVSSFKIYFSFSFCSDFNLEATVVKIDEVRGLKQLFAPFFILIQKKKFSKIIITASHKKNNNDQIFN